MAVGKTFKGGREGTKSHASKTAEKDYSKSGGEK